MSGIDEVWIVSIGGGYGDVFLRGVEERVEEWRRHKANWEHATARKRLATVEEVVQAQAEGKTINDVEDLLID